MAKNFVGININIDTTRIDKLQKDLEETAQNRAMDKALTWLTKRMKTYPPVRPSSNYQRTGNHRKGVIRLQRSRRSASVVFSDRYSANGKSYAKWVRDTKLQARVHRGRWPTSQSIAKEAEQKVKGFYESEFSKLKR